MSVRWQEKLQLAITPTPLQPLVKLSDQLKGPQIWIKRDDLTGLCLSGNKVRKLEFTLAHARSRGANLLIITCGGIQSNHCRATAFAGAQLGIPVHLVLRGTPDNTGNLLMDRLAGAAVSCYPVAEYRNNLAQLLQHWVHHYRNQGFEPHVIPTGASDGVGVWGYFAAVKELEQDFRQHNFKPDLIVTATGSGGTQAGLTLGCEYFNIGCSVLGMAVCDDVDYFAEKVWADIDDFLTDYGHCLDYQPAESTLKKAILTNDHYVGDGYGKASAAVLETIHMLAREEGILLDPVYSGKAFHGLVTEIRQGSFDHYDNLVFVHTGGLFGLFPYAEQFNSVLSEI